MHFWHNPRSIFAFRQSTDGCILRFIQSIGPSLLAFLGSLFQALLQRGAKISILFPYLEKLGYPLVMPCIAFKVE
jgi:hypothetical protein